MIMIDHIVQLLVSFLVYNMDKNTKESLYYQVNKMIDLLTDRDVRTVEIMLEGLRKEIQDGIYD